MIKKIIILILLLAGFSFGAFERRPTSARSSAMGEAYTSACDDIFSIQGNPAGLSYLKGLNIAANGYQFFNTDDIEKIYSFNLSTGMPIPRFGTFALSYNSFGFSLYRESEIILSHSFQFLHKISIGYNIKYLNLSIQDYGSDGVFAFDLGFLAAYSPNWRFGFIGKNINAPALAGSSDNISRSGELGITWLPVSGLLFSVSIAKSMGQDVYFKIGQEIHLLQSLYLRSGFQTRTMQISIGAGLEFSGLHLDYAFNYQNSLGPESILTLNFDFSKARRSVFREATHKKKGVITLADLGPESGNYEGDKININTASAADLANLPRIGPSTAQRIVEYRQKHGPFKKKEDIINVSRIGVKTYAKFREFITVGKIVEKNGKVQIAEEKPSQKNINDISLKELIKLKIPPLMAVKIINYREEKGEIKTLSEIKNINGIEDKDFNAIKPILEPLFKSKPKGNSSK